MCIASVVFDDRLRQRLCVVSTLLIAAVVTISLCLSMAQVRDHDALGRDDLARDMCCFYTPTQWVVSCLHWAADEKNVPFSSRLVAGGVLRMARRPVTHVLFFTCLPSGVWGVGHISACRGGSRDMR